MTPARAVPGTAGPPSPPSRTRPPPPPPPHVATRPAAVAAEGGGEGSGRRRGVDKGDAVEPETGRARRARSRRDTGLEPTAPPPPSGNVGGRRRARHARRGAARAATTETPPDPSAQPAGRPATDHSRLDPHTVRLPPRGGGASGPNPLTGERGETARGPGAQRATANDAEASRGPPPGQRGPRGARPHTRHGPRREADPGGGGTHFSGTRVRREGPLLHREGPRPGGGGGGAAGSPRAATPDPGPRTPDPGPPPSPTPTPRARHSRSPLSLPNTAPSLREGGGRRRHRTTRRAAPPSRPPPPTRTPTGDGGWGGALSSGGGWGRRGEAGAHRPGLHLGGRRARQSGPYEEAPSRATPGDNPRTCEGERNVPPPHKHPRRWRDTSTPARGRRGRLGPASKKETERHQKLRGGADERTGTEGPTPQAPGGGIPTTFPLNGKGGPAPNANTAPTTGRVYPRTRPGRPETSAARGAPAQTEERRAGKEYTRVGAGGGAGRREDRRGEESTAASGTNAPDVPTSHVQVLPAQIPDTGPQEPPARPRRPDPKAGGVTTPPKGSLNLRAGTR
ncbi:collagen alpha-1(I) chain-like [Cavia porcellus]|uniref:collagen alpha-1(I) chain-like n=1 Tax=Cavia porcellus TaxID=10141 RepID=UPI002FE4251F